MAERPEARVEVVGYGLIGKAYTYGYGGARCSISYPWGVGLSLSLI